MEALIGAIIGAFIGGVSVYFSDKRKYKFESKKASRELLLKKYESIFTELSKVKISCNEITLQMIGEITYEKKFDPSALKTKLADSTYSMNIKFYAPELANELAEIEAKHLELGSALVRFIADIGSDSKSDLMVAARVAANELGNLIDDAQSKLATIASERVDA